MTDTSGQKSCDSCKHADLSRRLASRLQAKTGKLGSTLYKMRWTEKVTPSGNALPWHVASVRRTKDNDCTSWPTPVATREGVGESPEAKKARGQNPGLTLSYAAGMTAWPTPTSRDHKDGKHCPNVPVNSLLGREVWKTENPRPARLTATGELLTGSSAQILNGGQLNPEHSRWLMGLPREYSLSGPTETP